MLVQYLLYVSKIGLILEKYNFSQKQLISLLLASIKLYG